jgi:hypothetical protein
MRTLFKPLTVKRPVVHLAPTEVSGDGDEVSGDGDERCTGCGDIHSPTNPDYCWTCWGLTSDKEDEQEVTSDKKEEQDSCPTSPPIDLIDLTSDNEKDNEKEESQCEPPRSPPYAVYGPRSPTRCQCLCLRKLDEMCRSLEEVKTKLEELKQVTVEREQQEVTGGKHKQQRRSKRLEEKQPYER